jgi:purine-binding chemotaxis protein CheW
MWDRESMTKGASKEEDPCLVFTLGQETHGIRIQMLREIVTDAGMKPLPPPGFEYCEELDFRGDRIPVLRLADFFDYSCTPDGPKSVLVLGVEGQCFGLLVDAVKGVWNIPEAELKPLPPLATYLDPQYIRGICKVEGRPVFLLREDAFLQMREIASFHHS